MNRRLWVILAAVGGSWVTVAGAQPAPAAPAAKRAPAAPAPASLQRSPEDRIARMVRAAEREGFERHEVERSMAIYAPDAVLITGRRAQPDAHDVRFDVDSLRAVLELRYGAGPSRQEQIFFRDVKVEIDGERATMTAVVTQELFGGREEINHRYTLARRDGRWVVVERRTWPIMRLQNGVPTLFTDEAWLAAEERVAAMLGDAQVRPEALLFALTEAGYLKQAHARTRAWTEAEPKSIAAWHARARFALEVGDVADARLASARVEALGK